jgi:transposase
LLADVETIWLDRGYDSGVTRERLAERDIADAVIAKKRKRGSAEANKHQPMGLRWPVERTNSWLSNFGQLRRNTDRRTIHRLAQFALAVTFLLTAKLIDWRNRWSPTPSPIR